MGISNWLAAVKEFNFKGKDFTGSKGPQRNAVLWGGGGRKIRKRGSRRKRRRKKRSIRGRK